jgi:ribosome-associated protein
MPRIEVTPDIAIEESEIAFSFVRSSGPGGQNVNKVETAAQLRFNVTRSASLDEALKRRLQRLAGARLTKEGVLVIFAQTHRSKEQNRREALARLLALIAAAAPKARVKTRPSLAARARRVRSSQSGSRECFARARCRLAAGASPKQADCAALFRTGKAGKVAQSDVAMMR